MPLKYCVRLDHLLTEKLECPVNIDDLT